MNRIVIVPPPDFAPRADHYHREATGDRPRGLAKVLGIDVRGLHRLRAGWVDRKTWAFPMCDVVRRVTGLRFRASNGEQWADGLTGVFLTSDTDAQGVLTMPDGILDSVALAGLNFDVVGRPDSTSCTSICSRLAHRRDAAIFCGPDSAGVRGAAALASTVIVGARSVRVVDVAPARSVREWVARGATHQDVLSRILSTPPRVLTVRIRGGNA